MRGRRILLGLLLCGSLALPAAGMCNPKAALTFDTSLFVENDVEIKSRLSGIIDEVLVDRGAEVKKGTPLARLDNKDLKLETERARAAMLEAELAFNRAKSLHEQQLLSTSDYDQKRLALDRAKAENDLAQVNYEKSIIVAPFAGIVVERYAHLGQRVVEDDNVTLFRITAMTPLLARIYVPEEQIPMLTVGREADFLPAPAASQKVAARIKWISSVIDPANGLAQVILEIRNVSGQQRLRPGTSGKITIPVE
jgi:RND family efflux transporter MFP subunit